MVVTKQYLHILRFISCHKTVSYERIHRKFQLSDNDLEELIRSQYIVRIGKNINEYGEPIPFCNETMFKLDNLGIAEVESHQWFSLQFVLLQIVLPIVIAIITTLITIFLTTLLSPSL